ncbi:diaminohydroxyphosphoribosylaminopyrimidine deaminase [Sphaerotilus hippei]|uniref:Riboflavin biosynthesis protein RibD n=1 Tax=Sphaerotilus hippei TaxID=744406 RepID=A0A318H425_9BURK|nr:bifunctional diaminohydroxyphosphoribosylaminopyrimidine deaminase/5-amino-6-(5-phosphoribosylamino)uracil reductase RibD [Sphaerotilus hippei]PXW98553.1 diaminohydroxyphosphoribosylaminopyrimidine deaminase [Sphaerotilus hippei]
MTHTPASSFSPADQAAMALAIAQAEQAIGLTDPNPRVGCVLVGRDGQLLGQGHTQQAGGPHAEVMAMRQARAAGHDLRGATAYVTLEPCAHHGRTPPCADALVEAGLGRVVAALVDPFAQVAGQGLARLARAGIVTSVGLMADEARAQNIGFLSRVLRQRPWVRLKVAGSLDGRTALPNGVSQWITGPAARADGHAWRRRASAVLTGIGTVLADDPGLDVRLVPTPRQPWRVVLDSRLRTPVGARLLDGPGETLICTLASPAEQDRWRQSLPHRPEAAGRVTLLEATPDARGRPALPPLLQELARRGVNELHVEAGAELAGALIEAGLVDEYLFYLAPSLLGPGRPLAALGPYERLEQARLLRWQSVSPVGDDLRLIARPADQDLSWLAS